MGKFIEPVIIQNVNKDIAPGALDYSGRRVLNPVRDVLNARYLTSEGEYTGKVEHIKGTSQGPTFNKFQEITVNGDFAGTLDPWIEFGAGDLSWAYSAGTARISTAVAGPLTTKQLIYNNPNAFLGQSAVIRAKVTLEQGFTSVKLFCHIYDDDTVLLETFSIGTDLTVPSTNEFVVNKILPAGSVSFAFSMEVDGPGGTSAANVDYFKVDAVASTSTPVGQNEVIGTFENVEKNCLYFWLWNSNGYHGVFQYNENDNEILQILADTPNDPVLKFNRYHLITGIGMIGDLLVWTDNNGPRCVNVTRSYTTLNENLISLAKIGPKDAPTFGARETDATVAFNRLASHSFQFAYLYIYKDNETSVLSPYSKLCSGDIHPEPGSTSRAKVLVSHTVDSEVTTILKEVRLLYRKNNDPQWYVWKQVTDFSSTIAEYFYNNEQGIVVAKAHAEKLFDQVPNLSKALTIFRGRIFLNIKEEGFDFVPPTITASLASNTSLDGTDIVASNTHSRGAYVKKNGIYQVGAFFRDDLGRISGITSKGVLHGPKLKITGTFDINSTIGTLDALNKIVNKFNVTLAGVGPANCDYFIGITKEQSYAQYMQVPAHLLLYVGADEGDDEVAALFELVRVANTQRHYQKLSSSTKYNYLHFLLPHQLPFVPDKDCYVRFAASDNITQVERVLDVIDGDIIVTGNFGKNNWSLQDIGIKNAPLIEIFKPNEVIEPFFYQIAGPYRTDANGALQTTSITSLDADTFNLFLKQFNFKPYSLSSFEKLGSLTKQNILAAQWIFVESSSPITTKSQTSTTNLIPERPVPVEFLSSIVPISGLTPDLTKSAWSRGWPVVEAKPLKQRRPATLRFSDPYIEGSEINGLNSFPVGNAYDKIGQDRSPITKLIAVGNILVAVHERHVTSIYIGEGIVRTGETGFITKVENVVGDDRKLLGGNGSYHAESIQEVDGQLFGYDIFSGCIWRYTVEGIIAVSDFGMMNYFKERSDAYRPYKDELRFVSGIDKYHKEYLITMPPLYANRDTLALQTINSGSFDVDFILNPALYTVGQTYRLRILLYKQTGTNDQTVTLNAYFENDELRPVGAEDITHKIITNSLDDADPIFLEFEYDGEDSIRIQLTGVTLGIYARISSEYQELEGETWAYNYKAKLWSHRYSFVPEFMGKVGNTLIGFKEGVLWKFNATEFYNHFFNKQYSSKIKVSANPQPGKDKTWSAVQIDRDVLALNDAGTLKVIEVSNDHGQASYTRAKEFDKENGVYGGPILKDTNTNPLLLPEGTIALRDGKDIRSKTLDITINCDSTGPARLQKLNVVGEHSEFSI